MKYMKINNKISVVIIFTCLIAILSVPVSASQDWIIDGNKVYIDTPDAYISVEPHTISQPQNISLNVISKSYAGNP